MRELYLKIIQHIREKYPDLDLDEDEFTDGLIFYVSLNNVRILDVTYNFNGFKNYPESIDYNGIMFEVTVVNYFQSIGSFKKFIEHGENLEYKELYDDIFHFSHYVRKLDRVQMLEKIKGYIDTDISVGTRNP